MVNNTVCVNNLDIVVYSVWISTVMLVLITPLRPDVKNVTCAIPVYKNTKNMYQSVWYHRFSVITDCVLFDYTKGEKKLTLMVKTERNHCHNSPAVPIFIFPSQSQTDDQIRHKEDIRKQCEPTMLKRACFSQVSFHSGLTRWTH